MSYISVLEVFISITIARVFIPYKEYAEFKSTHLTKFSYNDFITSMTSIHKYMEPSKFTVLIESVSSILLAHSPQQSTGDTSGLCY